MKLYHWRIGTWDLLAIGHTEEQARHVLLRAVLGKREELIPDLNEPATWVYFPEQGILINRRLEA